MANQIMARCTAISVMLLMQSFPAWSFYENETARSYIDVSVMTRVSGNHYYTSHRNFSFIDQNESGITVTNRVMINGEIFTMPVKTTATNSFLSYEVNVLQSYIPNNLLVGSGATDSIASNIDHSSNIERSDSLDWSVSSHRYLHITADRLNLGWHWQPFDIILGRQAINLATTFFFTPNDFFAPFSAQRFFRIYKPGVDGLRTDIELSPRSQFSAFFIAGYTLDNENDSGWSSASESDRRSSLVRYLNEWRDFQWAVIFGEVKQRDLVGFSLQGELFDWLGVRTEGHRADYQKTGKSKNEISLGIEHRWENGLNVNIELFYHGLGAKSVQEYSSILQSNDSSYLANKYAAVGASYEFTPLLIGDLVIIQNGLDHSRLLAMNATYSLSDEAELVINIGLPSGKKSQLPNLKSEYGLIPKSVSLELRWFL